MTAYYNENDPRAAAWLRELMKENVIAPGEVDERSIDDVRPSDLAGFKQCHFFAGIGVWSYALRQAGWSDERSVWTGSCPCQPFSAAGKRGGTSDKRHLWPAFFHLIEQCNPRIVFGEQVASKDGLAWLDTVQTDVEAAKYTFAAVDLCAAGIGAPHIRQRLYFVADAGRERGTGRRIFGNVASATRAVESERHQREWLRDAACDVSQACVLAHACRGRCQQRNTRERSVQQSNQDSAVDSLAHAEQSRRQGRLLGGPNTQREDQYGRSGCDGAVGGYWANADWIFCRDGKYRPVEPGTFPLANGITGRVGLLRGYGNALVAPLATAFIEVYQEIEAA